MLLIWMNYITWDKLENTISYRMSTIVTSSQDPAVVREALNGTVFHLVAGI